MPSRRRKSSESLSSSRFDSYAVLPSETAVGNAIDRRVAVVGHHTAWRLHDGLDDLGGVEIEDFDRCGGIAGGDETSLDCKWPHAGKHVSTVGCRVDRTFPNCDLCKQIVDV